MKRFLETFLQVQLILTEGSLKNVKDTLIKWISFSGTPVQTILEMSLAQTCQNSHTPLALLRLLKRRSAKLAATIQEACLKDNSKLLFVSIYSDTQVILKV